MRKIGFIILFLLFQFQPRLQWAEQPEYVSIPVVPNGRITAMNKPDRNSFLLRVNGMERTVGDVTWVERSLKKESLFGKEFLLSFFSDTVCDRLCNVIGYFISDVVDTNDSLIILTPLKAYRITVHRNRLKVIDEILRLVKADCRDFAIKKTALESDLRDKIKKIRAMLSGVKNFYLNEKNSASLFRFLISFPGEYKRYHEFNTILEPEKLKMAMSLFRHPESQKWWIHFCREDVNGITGEVRKLTEVLESSINDSSFAKDVSTEESYRRVEASPQSTYSASTESCGNKYASFIKTLRKIAGYHELCKRTDLEAALLLSNICFNSVIFESDNGNVVESVMRERPASSVLLRRISLNSGGISIHSRNPEKNIRDISSQDLGFYSITFPLLKNENALEIDIKAKAGDEAGYFYPERIEKDILEGIIGLKNRETCRIKGVKVGGNTIHFQIDRFGRGEEGDFGLLRVSLSLDNRSGVTVYSRAKTLRSTAGGKQIALSVQVPSKLRGEHKLNLSVVDLIARNKAEIQRDIKF